MKDILFHYIPTIAELYKLINCEPYTGCSQTHGTNFDILYKNPKITLFQE